MDFLNFVEYLFTIVGSALALYNLGHTQSNRDQFKAVCPICIVMIILGLVQIIRFYQFKGAY